MARPREFDEQQALSEAMHLFWEKGYEATSIGDLTERMGISRPSLYAAFGDKQELFTAALNKYAQGVLERVELRLQSHSSVRQTLRDYLHLIADIAYGRDVVRGCFCVNTMVELASRHPQSEEITKFFQSRLVQLFQDKILQGVHSGELSPELDTAAVAQMLTVSYIGLFVVLKSKPERSFVDNVIDQMVSLLK